MRWKSLGREIRRRAALCVLSWLCALWTVIDWLWRAGAHALPDLPTMVMVALLVVLPGVPVAVSAAIAVCAVAFMTLPVPGPDVNWLLSVPVCLAMAVLGHRWRSVASVIVALICGCLPGLFGTVTGSELLFALAPSVQSCAMWWCIGAMVGMAGDSERAKSVEAERSRQREHQLQLLGVLHDSLANDLVVAVLRCRAIVSRQSGDASILAEIREIEDILECSLVRLREDIIIPERAALGEDEGKNENEDESSVVPRQSNVANRRTDLQVAQTDPASNLTTTAAELDRWLKSQGWESNVRVTGNFSNIDAAVVRLAERCVRELGMNMLKHGKPGTFALEVDTDGECVRVLSSNPIDQDADRHSTGAHNARECSTGNHDADGYVFCESSGDGHDVVERDADRYGVDERDTDGYGVDVCNGNECNADERDSGEHDDVGCDGDGYDPGQESFGFNGDSDISSSRSQVGLSSHCGLALLQQELEKCGGSLQIANESGEWTVYAVIPRTASVESSCCV